ncbi:PH domain-like protein [Rhizopus microsporus ATCC 52813]|uniref:PH domain-like protein n=2 Tax=Rhizopus microsporus TaxID=58291 RepID=A0A2G4SX98_RHIZD|nr:PH domain-like protein [Rhizopus microsporus ATCC 52813]PHZ13410.1 PH domain-like protein [Rhizopus microsporus ATCC 52813]
MMNMQDSIQSDASLFDKPISIILFHLSMSHYIPLFEQAGIDLGRYLLMKDPKDFISIGIRDPGDLDILITCSKALAAHIVHKRMTSEETIVEEEEEDLHSCKSSHTMNTNSGGTDDIYITSCRPSIVKRAIDAYNHSSSSTIIPTVQSNTSSGAMIGTVRYRQQSTNKQNTSRPLSMPVLLPSHTPPPDYYFDMTFSKRLERCKSMIFPREEEGKEELPPYTCTVYKMGYVHIKKEFDAPDVRTKWRVWRKLYVELWGTVLRVYRTAPPKDKVDYYYTFGPLKAPYYYYHKYYYTPILTLSLAGAEASRALDYLKRPNVLRLTTQEGPQLLLRLSSHVEMISWVEHLQAAINISLDLEDRPMPKFITLPIRSLTSGTLDSRTIELERAREQRRREQREILI